MDQKVLMRVMPVAGRGLSSLVPVFLIGLSWMTASTFNVDTQFPVIFSGPERSYFGYTVAMILNRKGYVALISAPRANFTRELGTYEPGVLFCCEINSSLCEEVDITKSSLSPSFLRSSKLSYRMWLGVTLDVNPKPQQGLVQTDIVVCGHRHYRSRSDSINGICFILDRDLTPARARDLRPLDNGDKQYTYDQNEFVYRLYQANGQAGMSAVFSEDGSHLIIGAPGIFEGTGSVIYYSTSEVASDISLRSTAVKTPSPEIHPHSYFGYSMTRGKFLNLSGEQYAVGAPRDENHGKVYIISVSKGRETVLLQSEKGSELGDYFGASVLGINLNGDSFTDLLVGAPLYARETECDEGKVYVLISDGNQLTHYTELFGSRKSDARFGSSIADLGDLNKDGFGDFAVGAPYEDGKGAVYIYYGSESGLIAQYSQKIEAVQIQPNLAGFGIQISRGLDVDDNGYPDILIGSYVSSHAVLLRSRPVIEVALDVFFNPSKIKMDKAECVYNLKNLPCVLVDACLNYTGKQVPASLDFQCTLFEQSPSPRGFFYPYRYKNAATDRNVTVKIDTEACFALQFFLHSDIKDVMTPVAIHFSCQLAPSTSPNDTFDKTYPVVSPFSNQNITREIPFHSGCAKDDVCYCDITIQAELLGDAKQGTITLGNVSSVSVDITVRNEGEPAYAPELFIYLPLQMPIINEDFCDSRTLLQSKIVACRLGDPLVKGGQVNIRIKLDATKLAPHTNFVEIFFETATNSTETNPSNNILNISLEVKTISDVAIRGTPSHYLIMHHEGHEMSSIISHKYMVRNYGPSPLHNIDILLQVPTAILSSGGWKNFIYFTGLRTDGISDNIVPAVCNDTLLNIEKFQEPVKNLTDTAWENETIYYNESYSSSSSDNHIMKRRAVETSEEQLSPESGDDNTSSRKENGNFQIDCGKENIECVTLQCSASAFSDDRKFAEISVAFKIDYSVLNDHFNSWYKIELFTTGFISVPDPGVVLLPYHSEATRVKTVLHHGGQFQIETPLWLYSASTFIGSMLLLTITLILIKVGFFNRKEREMLKRLERSFLSANTDEEFLLDPSEEVNDVNE